MTRLTHCLALDGTQSQNSYISWVGDVPHDLVEGKSGLTFSFAAALQPMTAERIAISIDLQGTTNDGKSWNYNFFLPMENIGRNPLGQYNEETYYRDSASVDPLLWITRPEMFQEMPTDLTEIEALEDMFISWIPRYKYNIFNKAAQEVESGFYSYLYKKLYADPSDSEMDEYITQKLRMPAYSYYGNDINSIPLIRAPWTFFSGHIANHQDGFISINGKKSFISYGNEDLSPLLTKYASRFTPPKIRLREVGLGKISAKVSIVHDTNGVANYDDNRVVKLWIQNFWLGVTELYNFEQEWMDNLYDRETGFCKHAGSGGLILKGPVHIKPILYITGENGIINNVDDVECDSVGFSSVPFDESAGDPQVVSGGISVAAAAPPNYGHEVNRKDCLIRTYPRFKGNLTMDDSYYGIANSSSPNNSGYFPHVSVLPLPTYESYQKCFFAVVKNPTSDLKIRLNTPLEANKQIANSVDIDFSWDPGAHKSRVRVSSTGKRGINSPLEVTRFETLVNVGASSKGMYRKLVLYMVYYDAYNIDNPRMKVSDVIQDYNYVTEVAGNYFVSQTEDIVAPHYIGEHAHIALGENSNSVVGAPYIEQYCGGLMGGLWLYSQTTMENNPQVRWAFDDVNDMRFNFCEYVSPSYKPIDTGPYGDNPNSVIPDSPDNLAGIRPSLYIDPSVGLYCNSAYNAFQAGDSMTPNMFTDDVGENYTRSKVRPSVTSSSGYYLIQHIKGLEFRTIHQSDRDIGLTP